MFGLAKKFVSTLNSVTESNDSRMGLRVVATHEGSPATLESFFDFIVGCNGVEITQYLEINTQTGSVSTQNWVNFMNHEVNVANNDITLAVYSAKGCVEREVVIKASQFHEAGGLKLSVQLTPLKAAQYTWHVLKVQPNSPAYVAGIMPDEYILQSEDGLLAFGGEELLSRVIQSQYVKNNNQPIELVLYVYNYEADCVRPVRVIIREDWGGRGLLGCDIGYGLLHRIPEKFRITSDDGEDEAPALKTDKTPEFLHLHSQNLPHLNENASTDSLNALAQAVQSSTRPKRKNNGNNSALISEFMKEQTEISKSLDSSSPSVKPEGSVPPPPPAKKE